MERVEKIKQEFVDMLEKATSLKEVESLRVRYLGRKGPIHQALQLLRDVDPKERPRVGQELNLLKKFVESKIGEQVTVLKEKDLIAQLEKETIDITIPGRRPNLGSKHLLTEALDEIIEILKEMGFSIQIGPHIESDFYNFEALNIGPDHPARDMQDTFYLDETTVLRTHTSPVQIRSMLSSNPPIRIIAPGKAFRNEDVSARSHVLFHQVEGLYVDKGVSFADLLATLRQFLQKLLGKNAKTRFRASYFPFVEPGTEVDVECISCKGKGCHICKHTGWLEVLGAGMVHPKVLESGGIDPEVYSGYAWGMGLERLTMLRYGVDDIRTFMQNDVRFLQQFVSI